MCNFLGQMYISFEWTPGKSAQIVLGPGPMRAALFAAFVLLPVALATFSLTFPTAYVVVNATYPQLDVYASEETAVGSPPLLSLSVHRVVEVDAEGQWSPFRNYVYDDCSDVFSWQSACARARWNPRVFPNV